MHPPRTARGFSLIELVAVLAILAVLATAAVPLVHMSSKRLKEQELRLDLRQLRGAIDNYRRAVEDGRVPKKPDETGFPKKLDDLVKGVEDQRDPNKKKIYFLRAIPTDPFAAPGLVGAESWSKRSYASPPDDPREGDDVFDVHSLSDDKGLNGIAYNRW